jgi:hypothetical protein
LRIGEEATQFEMFAPEAASDEGLLAQPAHVGIGVMQAGKELVLMNGFARSANGHQGSAADLGGLIT